MAIYVFGESEKATGLPFIDKPVQSITATIPASLFNDTTEKEVFRVEGSGILVASYLSQPYNTSGSTRFIWRVYNENGVILQRNTDHGTTYSYPATDLNSVMRESLKGSIGTNTFSGNIYVKTNTLFIRFMNFLSITGQLQTTTNPNMDGNLEVYLVEV